MEIKILWDKRYSETEEPDEYGRWARVAYVGKPGFNKNGVPTIFEIAWIKRLEHQGKIYFTINFYFPSSGKIIFNTLYEAQKHVEERFGFFINTVNKYAKI